MLSGDRIEPGATPDGAEDFRVPSEDLREVALAHPRGLIATNPLIGHVLGFDPATGRYWEMDLINRKREGELRSVIIETPVWDWENPHERFEVGSFGWAGQEERDVTRHFVRHYPTGESPETVAREVAALIDRAYRNPDPKRPPIYG